MGFEVLPNRRVGTEVSEYVKSSTGAGIIHSDELPKFGITQEEVDLVKKSLDCKKDDAFIITACKKESAENAIEAAVGRLKAAGNLIPKEVRKAEEDGTTTFMRPLPGAARLYPETDVRPIRIEKQILNFMKENLPELWDDKIGRFVRDYKMNKDNAGQIVKSEYSRLFENIVRSGFEPNLVFRSLTSMLSELKAEGINTDNLTDDILLEVFKKSPKTISKEALYQALRAAATTGKAEKTAAGLSEEEVRKIVKSVISKNKDALAKHNAEQILMGEAMKEVRGKAPGSLVMKILNEEMGK